MIALRYSDHFGFTEMPFRLTPDARFFYRSEGHRRAMAHLLCGLAQEEGFVVITGDVGAGKTTLIEYLRGRLDGTRVVIGVVPASAVGDVDMLRMVARALGVPHGEGSKVTLLGALHAKLQQVRAAGSRCLLIVDEVQGLSFGALEELRLLSNYVEGGRPLLQLVLVGQPQFRATLACPDVDQLRQRVIACYHLGPLTEAETHVYIMHRLVAVGWSGRPVWSETASLMVHIHTQGVPRRVNRLCARILMQAALDVSPDITPSMVDLVAQELDQDLGDLSQPVDPALLQSLTQGGHAIPGLADAQDEHIDTMRRVFGGPAH